VEVEACDGGRGVHVQLAGHTVQGGQPQVDAAHGQHAGLEQVDVAVLVSGHLGGARAAWAGLLMHSTQETGSTKMDPHKKKDTVNTQILNT